MEVTVPERLQGAYAVAYLTMTTGETVHIERGRVHSLTDGFDVGPGLGTSGVRAALARKLFGGQTLLTARLTATHHGAWVEVAPPMPGDICAFPLSADMSLWLTQGSFLACEDSVRITTHFAGARNVLMREGVTRLMCTGPGMLLFATYGGLQRVVLREGETLYPNVGHVVAWTAPMEPNVGLAQGPWTSLLTGKGLLTSFTGPGELFMQSRSAQNLQSWLFPRRKHRERSYRR